MAGPEWNGLLKWSLAQQDGTASNKDVKPLAPEDKKFLEDVMSSIVQDPIKRMKEVLEILRQPDGDSLVPKESALDELDDLVLLSDFANDLHKLGGMALLVDLLASPHTSLQSRAAQVIATCVQNNPQSQANALSTGALERLTQLLLGSTHSEVVAKALLALSGLVKSNSEAEARFCQNNGYSVLLRLLSTPELGTRVTVKALHLQRHLWSKSNFHTLPAHSSIVPVLVKLLDHEDLDIREAALKAILELTDGSDSNMDQFLDPSLDLAQILRKRKATIEGFPAEEDRDQCRDELESISSLLAVLAQ